jgi:hypothetical protein
LQAEWLMRPLSFAGAAVSAARAGESLEATATAAAPAVTLRMAERRDM